MKTVEGIRKELKALDGVVGAFVLNQADCLATSLPPQYDTARLVQVGGVLSRINQMSQKAGFDRCATAFHWQRASLLTWPLGEEALLAVLAAPNAVREAVELSASMAVEELSTVVFGKTVRQSIPTQTGTSMVVPSLPTASAQQQDSGLTQRLERLEQLLVEELGASGKPLLERAMRKAPRGGAPLGTWLLELRRAVLSEILDPAARVTVAMSVEWAEAE
ncbi:MAG: hypothetical protein QM784_23475 [Polyangiaceae bacterium]